MSILVLLPYNVKVRRSGPFLRGVLSARSSNARVGFPPSAFFLHCTLS